MLVFHLVSLVVISNLILVTDADDQFLPAGVSLKDIIESDDKVSPSDVQELETFLRSRKEQLREALVNAKNSEAECGHREERNSVSGECQCIKYYAAWVLKITLVVITPIFFSNFSTR